MNTEFYGEIRNILISARNKVYQTANIAMVEAYWQIGKSIVAEQGGEERSEYGSGLLDELSRQMTKDFGKGFTVTNLKYMRQFYLTFPNRHALRDELSWTHYRLLLRVENEKAREFYLEEAVRSQWSTRQLERQINSFFYERLLSSRSKEAVSREIQTLEPAKSPEDIIRDPYVLEFLGLSPSVYPFYPIQRLPQGTGQSVKKKSRRLRCDLIKFYNKNPTSRDTPYNTWNNRTSSSELMTMNMNKSAT